MSSSRLATFTELEQKLRAGAAILQNPQGFRDGSIGDRNESPAKRVLLPIATREHKRGAMKKIVLRSKTVLQSQTLKVLTARELADAAAGESVTPFTNQCPRAAVTDQK